MNPADVAQRFYQAFHRRDWAAMGACYHPEATFTDPAFGTLDATQARAMWQMLLTRAQDLRVEPGPITTEGGTARLTWQAWYTFTGTGRNVHNRIHAELTIREGLILRHVDQFDLYRWSRQALGPLGLLLGWTPWLQGRIRAQARGSLTRFLAQHS